MRRIEALLCDLDGTICDSEWAHIEAWELVVRGHGFELDEGWDLDYVGKPDDFAAVRMRERYPSLPPAKDLLAERHGAYRKIIAEHSDRVSYPGVAEALEKLAAAGIKLAVGTNSPWDNTIAALRAAGIERFFPVIVAYGMTPRGKPAPDLYVEAALRLDVDPAVCAVVEDTPIGIDAGKAAGAFVVAVTTTNTRDALVDADIVLDSPAAAMNWILDNARGVP
ncbi:MAG: HAD family phosphatase [Planctomycetota bacterium]|nr:HAD family phosphatase [Planctomycetota bacterium]